MLQWKRAWCSILDYFLAMFWGRSSHRFLFRASASLCIVQEPPAKSSLIKSLMRDLWSFGKSVTQSIFPTVYQSWRVYVARSEVRCFMLGLISCLETCRNLPLPQDVSKTTCCWTCAPVFPCCNGNHRRGFTMWSPRPCELDPCELLSSSCRSNLDQVHDLHRVLGS